MIHGLFREQCELGLRRLYGDNPSQEAVDRLRYETGVIEAMGYVDYFLIVADFIDYARKKIFSGAGRGSGAKPCGLLPRYHRYRPTAIQLAV